MSDRPVGLRFLLRGGSFLGAVMPESEARETVRRWISNDFGLRGIDHLGDPDHPGGSWGVKVDDIVGIHTYELEGVPPGVPPQAPATVPRPPFPGWNLPPRSGG